MKLARDFLSLLFAGILPTARLTWEDRGEYVLYFKSTFGGHSPSVLIPIGLAGAVIFSRLSPVSKVRIMYLKPNSFFTWADRKLLNN